MKGFGKLLSEAMDDTMRRVFGEYASELIFRHMERQVMVKRGEIGEKIEVFCAYLERVLGSEGAQVVQATTLKRLCLKLRLEYEEIETYFWFLDRLYEAKFRLLASLLGEDGLVCD